jgi:RNA polymerase sigma-70 factor, ECF subfamily
VSGDAAGRDPAADTWLLDKARGGSSEAFEVLVRRHRLAVYRIALRMLGNRADAEDVTQDVFIQAWTALAGFAGRSSFSTWLYRIVVNRCLSHQRRHRVTEPMPDAEPAATTAGPEQTTVDRQRADATIRAIAGLPPDLRAVFVLHQSERLSYAEVATILTLSEATVRGRLARARRMLLDELKAWS